MVTIEEHDGRRHRGLSSDKHDIVVKSGSGQLLLSKPEAYQLCYKLLQHLEENPYLEE